MVKIENIIFFKVVFKMQNQNNDDPRYLKPSKTGCSQVMSLAELEVFQLTQSEFIITPEAVGLPNLPNVRKALVQSLITDPNCLFAAFVIAENLCDENPDKLDNLIAATILSGSQSSLEISIEFSNHIQSLVFEVDLQKNLPKHNSSSPDFSQFSKDAQRILLAYDMLFKESSIRDLKRHIFNSERSDADEIFHQNLKTIFRQSVQAISKIDIGADQLLLNTYVRNFNDLALRYNSDTYLCPLKPGDKKVQGSFFSV